MRELWVREASPTENVDVGFMETVRRSAEATSPRRNRAVDLFRALSILVVVWGHWTMAAVTMTEGRVVPGHVLVLATWTHPLTWLFQVMPVFFLVGGYANGISWQSARQRGTTYGGWLRGRTRRLSFPVVPVLLFWFAFGWVALRLGMTPDMLRTASTVALVPTWFLASYTLVVATAPLGLLAWQRWGWWSVVAGTALAGVVDAVSLGTGSVAAGFLNYLVVWATVHQVGIAWLEGGLDSRRRRLLLVLVGLAGALTLVVVGPYPVSMVGVDTETVNNTYPSRVTLVFLGLFQAGVVLLLEGWAQRLTRRAKVWTAVVAINGRIMTLYLWHVTAMVLVIGVSAALGGPGLHLEPLSGAWWLSRPVWYAVLALATVGLVTLLGRFETPRLDDRPPPPAWRPLLTVVAVCGGLAAVAVTGVVGRDGSLNAWLLVLPLGGLVAGGAVRPPKVSRWPR